MSLLTRPVDINHHLKRHRQVVQVLLKHGFGQLVDQMRLWDSANLRRHTPTSGERRQSVVLTRAERVRLALEELGPTYIKLGQMLSTRPDVIPPEYIAELEKLQDHVAAFPDDVAREIVQAELGHSLKEVFSSFGKQPVAAASLSQVYRGVLKGGQAVAVKVQRPGISETVKVDLEIIHDLASRMEQHFPEACEMGLLSLVEEFSDDMKKEINFSVEAHNMRHFAHNFEGEAYIHVPIVYPEYCTSKLLVMEFMDGINISKVDKLKAAKYDLKQIAHNGADVYLKSILEHGFFHADPHPGNILIMPDNVIGLVDFGAMGRLSARDREILAGMLDSLVEYDAKGMTRFILELANPRTAVNTEQLESDISGLIEDYAYLSLDELNLSEVLDQMMRLLRNHQLQLPKYYVWLFRVISMVENIGRQLDPGFNLATYSKSYVRELGFRQINPRQRLRELRLTAVDFLKLAKDFPFEIRTILKQAREGRIKMEIEPVGLEPYRLTVNRIFNRVVVAIIVAAVVVGSSIIINSGLPPLVSGIPVIGLAGFTLATLLGIWVIISVLRNGIS
jgi:ubiquinone biosynthesis protein